MDREEKNVTYTDSDRERYLDGVIARMECLKMQGKPVSFEKVIGRDSALVGQLFGLQEFSPRVRSEVVLELAYLRSDAFRDRAVRSFGYVSADDMPENVRKVFDQMVERGRNAGNVLRFHVSESGNFRHGDEEVWLPSGRPELNQSDDDTMTVSHEIAHEVYWGSDLFQYRTGSRKGGFSDGQSFRIGQEDSPLMRLDKDEVDADRFQQSYYKNFVQPNLDYWKTVCFPDDDSEKNFLAGRFRLLPEFEDFFREAMEHDEMRSERGSEVHETRMLLFREGIWNPFSGEPLKREHVEELQRRFPHSRIFEYWDVNKAVYFLDNIAQNGRQEMMDGLNRDVNDRIRSALASVSSSGSGVSDAQRVKREDSLDVAAVVSRTAIGYEQGYEAMESEQQEQSKGLHA